MRGPSQLPVASLPECSRKILVPAKLEGTTHFAYILKTSAEIATFLKLMDLVDGAVYGQ